MAYTYEINKNSVDSHQTNPSYVITFIPQDNRDRFHYTKNKEKRDAENIQGEDPNFEYNDFTKNGIIVVENDCVQLTVSCSKTNPSPTVSMVLMAGDINYAQAIGPGDYILVNMLNSEEEARRVGDASRALSSINSYKDGFKGMFKVQTCRRKFQVDPGIGSKIYYFEITGFGFTEYNNTIYYNPVLSQFDKQGSFFLQNFNNYLNEVIVKKGENTIQNVLKILLGALIGSGNIQGQDLKIKQSPNTIYKIPKALGSLLNIKNAQKMIDINKIYLGIWNGTNKNKSLSPKDGFNLDFTKNGNIYECGSQLQGVRILAAEYWNCVKVWSILQSYSNDLINEMYTCYRVADDGHIYPSLVVRQKPFNSSTFKDNTPHSKFLDLPRWKISPDIAYSADLGKDEASRINFVQVYTRSIAIDPNINMAMQTGLGNYIPVTEDIQFHGLRPYMATAAYDFPSYEGGKESKAVSWTKLVSDWVIGGHNKESGTLQTVGIIDPICVGDNIEFDGVVYHVEQINHTMSISGDKKLFRTNFSLSHGVSLQSTHDKIVYAESKYSHTKTRREADFNNSKILPGFSDTQDIRGREKGELKTIPKDKKGNPT